MSGHNNSIEPLREQGDEATEWAITTGTPESYGFPQNPTVPESKRWAMQEAFLAEFSRTHLLCASADAAGISPQAVEQWRHGVTTNGRDLNSFNFDKRFALASLRYQERLDAEIDRRAVEGIDHPVIYKEYSDNLLMFRRKKLDPSYRDNYATEVRTTNTDIKITKITVRSVHDLPPVDEGQTFSREITPPAIESEVREVDQEQV